jgi:hypothetical protein
MSSNPCDAWKAVRILQKGSFSHHRSLSDFSFRDPITKVVSTTPAGNLRILGDHCKYVYNQDDAPPEYAVVTDIDHHETLPQLGDEPMIAEMHTSIDWMANNKSPGESTIPAEALKALLLSAHKVRYAPHPRCLLEWSS